jgi:hypothetical protein
MVLNTLKHAYRCDRLASICFCYLPRPSLLLSHRVRNFSKCFFSFMDYFRRPLLSHRMLTSTTSCPRKLPASPKPRQAFLNVLCVLDGRRTQLSTIPVCFVSVTRPFIKQSRSRRQSSPEPRASLVPFCIWLSLTSWTLAAVQSTVWEPQVSGEFCALGRYLSHTAARPCCLSCAAS